MLRLFRTSPLDLANLMDRPFITLTNPHANNMAPPHIPATSAAPKTTQATTTAPPQVPTTNKKRKKNPSDSADAGTKKKRKRPVLTIVESAAPIPGSEVVGASFTAINVPKTDTRPTKTEHPYAPTAPKPEPTLNACAPTSEPATTEDLPSPLLKQSHDSFTPDTTSNQDLNDGRLAPLGSIK